MYTHTQSTKTHVYIKKRAYRLLYVVPREDAYIRAVYKSTSLSLVIRQFIYMYAYIDRCRRWWLSPTVVRSFHIRLFVCFYFILFYFFEIFIYIFPVVFFLFVSVRATRSIVFQGFRGRHTQGKTHSSSGSERIQRIKLWSAGLTSQKIVVTTNQSSRPFLFKREKIYLFFFFFFFRILKTSCSIQIDDF
jgi:hypothetical protein